MAEESIFTKIINGDIPCHKVYEDDQAIAFLDIHPQVPGHILLVPKLQVDHLWDLPDDAYHHLWEAAKKIQARVQEVLQPPRVGVAVEGFGVAHAHIHLLPLQEAADFKKPQDLDSEPDHEALQRMASKLAF